MEYIADRKPTDVRIVAINLDADEELERVVVARAGMDVEAVVLQEEDGVWWSLGQWMCCGPKAVDVDPFLEIRQLVWHGTNDILVHIPTMWGTGVGERRLWVYRLRNGTLYRVLDIVEGGHNWSESEQARVEYPDAATMGATEPQMLTVCRVKSQSRRSRGVRERYRWDAKEFVYRRLPGGGTGCQAR